MASVWKADDIQTALVNEGLMTHEQRTLVQHGGDTHHNLQPKTAYEAGYKQEALGSEGKDKGKGKAHYQG